MSPDVSRLLARAMLELRLGSTAVNELAREFADTPNVDDLPAWVRELSDHPIGEPAVQAAASPLWQFG